LEVWAGNTGNTTVGAISASTISPTGTTSTAVVSTVNPAVYGSSVTFQATVTPRAIGGNTATGNVTFMDGSTTLGTQILDGSGHASLTTANLALGTHAITAVYSGDTNFSSSTSAVVNQLIVYSHASNQLYVTSLYRDVLGRAPDPGGLASWTALLDAGTDTILQVATVFTSSREYDTDIVDGFYNKYLNRHAEPGGLNDWVNLMQGGENADTIQAGILGSPEYFADTGGTNSSFVTALYRSFMNSVPDPLGKNFFEVTTAWTTVLNNNQETTAQVATFFLNSDENHTDIITGFYTTYLHRAPDPGGLTDWMNLLTNGVSQPTIITGFVTSPEYLAINNIT